MATLESGRGRSPSRPWISRGARLCLAVVVLSSVGMANALGDDARPDDKVGITYDQLTSGNTPLSEADLLGLWNVRFVLKSQLPKLFANPDETKKFLLLYMILQELSETVESGSSIATLANLTPADIAERYIDRTYSLSAPAPNAERPASANKLLMSRKTDFGVWYDDTVWAIQTRRLNADQEYLLAHKSDELWAMTIPEKLELTYEFMKMAVVENMRNSAENPTIKSEEHATVNGVDVLRLRVDATSKGLGFTFYYQIYTGKHGTFQLVGWTLTNLFHKHRSTLQALFRGFVIGR